MALLISDLMTSSLVFSASSRSHGANRYWTQKSGIAAVGNKGKETPYSCAARESSSVVTQDVLQFTLYYRPHVLPPLLVLEFMCDAHVVRHES